MWQQRFLILSHIYSNPLDDVRKSENVMKYPTYHITCYPEATIRGVLAAPCGNAKLADPLCFCCIGVMSTAVEHLASDFGTLALGGVT